MMKTIKYALYILLLCALTGACISEFNAKLPDGEIDILVVEGNIISDSIMEFAFSKSFSLSEEVPPLDYSNVRVTLRLIGSDGYQSEPASYVGNGIHRLYIKQLDANTAYGIEFEYNGETYRSELTKPLKTPEIDEVSFVQPEEYKEVSIRVSSHDNTPGHCYFMWTYTEDWEIAAHSYTTAYFDTNTNKYQLAPYPLTYYCWKNYSGREIMIGSTEKLTENSITNHTLLKYSPTSDRFSELYSILVKQQSISKAAYEYYLDKLKDNEGMGGLFTPQPSETVGNISCISTPSKRVIGYVGVVQNVATSRLYITRAEITVPSTRSNCLMIDGDSLATLTEKFSPLELYKMGLRPLDYDPYLAGLLSMTQVECVDCTYNGGTKNKPDFWPNNHK